MTERTTEEIARQRTAEELRRVGDLIQNVAYNVASATESGADVDPNDLIELRERPEELYQLADDVCVATNTPRWGTGVPFGDLSETEKQLVGEQSDPRKHPAEWAAECYE